MASTALANLLRMLRDRPPQGREGVAEPKTLEAFRRDFERFGRIFRLPEGVEVTPGRLRLETSQVEVEEVRPASSSSALGARAGATPVVVYVHGGGFVAGSVATHRALVARLALATGYPVVSVGYRLAPEHPFPAALEDTVMAVRALLAQPTTRCGSRCLALAGDSAGGGLALSCLLALRERLGRIPVSAAAVISPWTDLAATGESLESHAHLDPILTPSEVRQIPALYLGDHDPTDPLASPLYGDLQGLPPLLIQAGTSEILLDDARRLASRAQAHGVDATLDLWPEMIHAWHLYATLLPEGAQAIQRVGEYLRRHLSCAAEVPTGVAGDAGQS